MKSADNELDRLMRSAARAARPAVPTTPPFGLETRVIADWRALGRGEGNDFPLAWFRRAAIGGGVLALASLVWSFSAGPTGLIGDELSFADSAVMVAVNHD